MSKTTPANRKRIAVGAATLAGACLLPSLAAAQYYQPPQPHIHTKDGGVIQVDPGFREGLYPQLGVGIADVGAGVSAGFGARGVGAGATAGVGPLGATADAGISEGGLGARASAGVGGGTGANADLGFGPGGIGAGASAKLLGFGTGASIGIGERGPGLGASLALGPLGTIVIGSHRNSYPGAEATRNAMDPNIRQNYYEARPYGGRPAYRGQLNQPEYRQETQYSQPMQYSQPTQYARPTQYYATPTHYSQPSRTTYGHATTTGHTIHSAACPPGWTGECR